MIGQTIRHYTIEEKIGQGGMGEVYRATDSKLRKSVALKFLPESTAQDETARKRLLREARAAAQLDHPYICQVYEVGQADGIDYIVMEYVSGKTLREKLREGRLPVEDCLRIAAEISEALDNAQEKGIVHRDLKPSNIMLTRDDHVKLMDFGLAKTIPVGHGSQLDSLSQSKLTQAGFTVGTPAYMSPEQLQQGVVDSRSDMFALGIILYEMLAGTHPFLKGDVVGTMSAILRDEPRPLTLQRQGLHPVVQHIVRKMLAKDPKKRYQYAREIHTDLVAVMQDSGPVGPVPDPPVPIPKPSWSVPLWLVIPMLVLVAAGVWALRPPGLPASSSFELVANKDLFWENWTHPGFAVSPDGEHVVFKEIDSPRLQVRGVHDGQQRALEGTEGGRNPFFSPDGEWVGFFAPTGPSKVALKKVPLWGGRAEVLRENTLGGAGSRTGTWASEGTIFVGANWAIPFTVEANGANYEELSQFTKGDGVISPVWLPRGAGILSRIRYWENGPRTMGVLDPETSEYKELEQLKDVSYAVYAESGHLVYSRADSLFAIGFDLENLETVGSEVPLGIRGVMHEPSGTLQGLSYFSLSRNGTLVYLPGARPPHELVKVNRNGEVKVLPVGPDYYRFPRIFPDGHRALVRIGDQLWIVNLESGGRVPAQITLESTSPAGIVWMPDGERIITVSERRAYAVNLDGTGEREFLFEIPGTEIFHLWGFSQDGRYLIARHYNGGMSYVDFHASPLEFKEVGGEFEGLQNGGLHHTISPNGKWAASSVSGGLGAGEIRGSDWYDQDIWVSSFPAGLGRFPVAERVLLPEWSADGRIYFWQPEEGKLPNTTGNGSLLFVETQTEDEFSFSGPHELLDLSEHRIHPGYNFVWVDWDVSQDGEFLIMLRTVDETKWRPPRHFKVIEGFHDILREKVPVKN